MAWQGFEVFRRRQKVILAALAVLAMGLFIVGDVLIGVRMGHYGLGYGLRSWFYDTRLEELLTLHDHRVAAMRALFAAHHRARERWLQSRFQVADPKDIKDENLRKEYDQGTLQATRTWLGQLYQGLTLFGLAGDTFPLDAEGLLQFAYWKAEANRLGVVVAPEILRSDFERFTFNQLDDRELLNIVHRELRLAVSQEQLFTWWGDEIRAALARKVSCGTNPQRVVPPTLLDLWEAYRDLGTRLPQVAVITLNVHEDRFAKAVPEPSEEELRKYFDQHKQREPDPLQAEPGFRVPTRYRVEFIYADVRYDPNDPARTGEAWQPYRQLVEAVYSLPHLLACTPALSNAGPFLPAFAAHGLSLQPYAYQRYLAEKDSRFRLGEPRTSYALTETPAGQLVHHHGILPPGTGPWYRPAAAEMEQATQAVAHAVAALTSLPAAANPLAVVGRPISIRGPYAAGLAADIAASVGHTIGLAAALASPVVAGQEPATHWPASQVEMAAAASLVGSLVSPGIPAWSESVWAATFRPPQGVPPVRLVPGYDGLAMTWWTPPAFVPFQDAAAELTLAFLRDQVVRFLDADLRRLQADLAEYRQLYDKAYSAWRKTVRKPAKERFQPPPFGPNKEPLDAYLQRFCQARGLRYFPMPQPRSRFELMPRASGELGKILYPLYMEAVKPRTTATSAMDLFRQELDFADAIINGQGLLMDIETGESKTQPTPEGYGLYQARYVVAKGAPYHKAIVWKAEELPGYVPNFEEVRQQVHQAWIKEKARGLAQQHAEQLAQRLRQLQEQRRAPIEDLLRELRGDPTFPELNAWQTVELRRYQYQPISQPLTGLETTKLPGPSFRAVDQPPVVDYPQKDFLQQAFDRLHQPGDTWITTNLPGDKVYVLVLVSERRVPQPAEFAMDYLRRPEGSRIRVEDAGGFQQSLEQWVSRRNYRRYQDQFLQFLRQRYGLDEEKWRQLQDHVRRY